MKRFIIDLLAIGFFFFSVFSVQAEPIRERGKAFYRDYIQRVEGDNAVAKSSAAKITFFDFEQKTAVVTVEWTIKTNGPITGSTAIGLDGTIYFGSNDSTFYAIDPLYGRVKWRKKLDGMSISSPVIGEDGTIFAASTSDYEEKDKPRSFVYAFNPDGSLKWEYEINPGQFEDGVYNSPTIWKNNAGSPNWLVMVPSQKGDSLIALDPATGLEVHERTVGPFYTDYSAFPGMNGYVHAESFCEGAYTGFFPSTPRRDLVVGGTQILDPEDGLNYFPGFQIFSRFGEKKFRYLFEPYYLTGDSIGHRAALMFATPAIDRDGTIYFGTARGGIFYAFYSDGTLKWKKEIEQQLVWDTLRGIGSSAVIGEENVFFTTQHGLVVCLSKYDGMEIWKKDTRLYLVSSPLLGADGTLYVCTSTSAAGPLIAMDSNNGFIKWQYHTDGGISSSPVLSDKGILYVGDIKGKFYAIDTGTNAGPSKAPWPMYGRDARHSAAADPNPLAVQNEMPKAFVLEQNSPNPFNPSTMISFSLPKTGQVRLEIYNATGQKVATLANGLKTAGRHSFVWDAKSFASGIYFYVLKAEDLVQTRKMVLLK